MKDLTLFLLASLVLIAGNLLLSLEDWIGKALGK